MAGRRSAAAWVCLIALVLCSSVPAECAKKGKAPVAPPPPPPPPPTAAAVAAAQVTATLNYVRSAFPIVLGKARTATTSALAVLKVQLVSVQRAGAPHFGALQAVLAKTVAKAAGTSVPALLSSVTPSALCLLGYFSVSLVVLRRINKNGSKVRCGRPEMLSLSRQLQGPSWHLCGASERS